MIKALNLTYFLILIQISSVFAQRIEGHVYDEQGNALPFANVIIQNTKIGASTNDWGKYRLENIPAGEHIVVVSFMGYEKKLKQVIVSADETVDLDFYLNVDAALLNEVEVFGSRFKQPEKLYAITRMPLRPSEQIQSISIISDKMIQEQGVQTVTEAVQNIPGVTLFGSYGGVRESMSIRGYRGVPVLKNGVRIDSDFRTGSAMTEMQGVESVQVIKGTAAITQGLGNDLGSGGGVINVVTKTPKFTEEGLVSLRSGSWGYVSPSFDFQGLLNNQKTLAFRLNGTFQRSDHYRPVISSNRVYINPSVKWRPDEKTTITMELDYMNDNRTPHTSTVNFAGNDTEALYDMPFEKFLGFNGDNVNNKTTTYTLRANRMINDYFSVRAAYYGASYHVDNTSTSVSTVVNDDYERRRRTVSRSLRDDQNATFQLDLIGRDIYTGVFRHTFQVGFDYKVNNLSTTSFGTAIIDTIHVTQPGINNEIGNVNLTPQSPVESGSSAYGILVQEVLSYKEFLRAIFGVRYSYGLAFSGSGTGATPGDAWNPMLGLMVSPVKNIHLFGSYATTTSLRSAANRMPNGEQIGPSTTKQRETGIKSDWLNNRLRFNFTYFDVITENLSNTEYVEGTNQPTGYYYKAGDLKRNGIEVELSGRPAENFQLILGYAYLNARYENSPSYVEGSSPMNAPEHTANGWLYYTLDKTPLKGFSVGVGTYYVGARPSNEYSLRPDGHGTPVGAKPFDMPAYTTTNVQLAYPAGRFTVRAFINNLFDNVGYNAYFRGGFINQTDPRNISCVLSYQF
jgi:iron complex outermembrane receptor protein